MSFPAASRSAGRPRPGPGAVRSLQSRVWLWPPPRGTWRFDVDEHPLSDDRFVLLGGRGGHNAARAGDEAEPAAADPPGAEPRAGGLAGAAGSWRLNGPHHIDR